LVKNKIDKQVKYLVKITSNGCLISVIYNFWYCIGQAKLEILIIVTQCFGQVNICFK
jgi:hypothetical protein